MKSGRCPKCGATDIRMRRPTRWKWAFSDVFLISTTMWKSPSTLLDCVVCAHCGYVERYVSDPKALQAIAAQWERVNDGKYRTA